MESALNIQNYVQDGFEKVCAVTLSGEENNHYNWFYKDINQDLMYADHRSWLYFIVVNGEIWKVGETGNPLGLRYKRDTWRSQPKPGTEGRLGRYRTGDYGGDVRMDTDWAIRERLHNEINEGALVEFWAKKCPIAAIEVTVAGNKEYVGSAIHKELEMSYLDYIFEETGNLPKLNKLRK